MTQTDAYEQVRQAVQPVVEAAHDLVATDAAAPGQSPNYKRAIVLYEHDVREAEHQHERAAMRAVVLARQAEHLRFFAGREGPCARCDELTALLAEIEEAG